MSIAILTFFMIEVFFKIFVFRLEFFNHKFEILDSVIVVVSFVLDIIVLFQEHELEALGLLILLRLWRVARIINGMSPALLGYVPCTLLGCRADRNGWRLEVDTEAAGRGFQVGSSPPCRLEESEV